MHQQDISSNKKVRGKKIIAPFWRMRVSIPLPNTRGAARPRNRQSHVQAQVRADMALHNELWWCSLRSPHLEHAMLRRTKPSHMCVLVRGSAREMWLCSRQRYGMIALLNNVEGREISLACLWGTRNLSACTMINAQARYD